MVLMSSQMIKKVPFVVPFDIKYSCQRKEMFEMLKYFYFCGVKSIFESIKEGIYRIGALILIEQLCGPRALT